MVTAHDRVAVVTGARRGIGAAIATALAAQGYRIAVHHVGAADEAAAVSRSCHDLGVDAFTIEADLAVPDAAGTVVAEVVDRYGRVDVLVNNAAQLSSTTVTDLSATELRAVVSVNLEAPILLAQHCAPEMARRDGGRIVNITSVTVRHGGPSGIAYVASKAGLVGATRVLARELGAMGITVNAVSPGVIQTESEVEVRRTTRPGVDPAVLDAAILDRQAVKRRLVADDVAAAVAFLASDAAAGITGQVLEVNGGWIMR